MRMKKPIIVPILIGCLVMVFAACTSGDVATTVPTQILIPVTATPTPIIPTATPTAPPPPGPADLLPTAIPAHLAALETDQQRQIAQLVLDDLSQTRQLAAENIQVIAVTAIRLESPEVDCATLPDTATVRSYPGFQVILTVNAVVYDYRTDPANDFRLCDETPIRAVTGDVLLLVDPVAADMFALTQRRLAQEFNLPMRRIQLLEMQAVAWRDSSLGCPVEGQDYAAIIIDGYRLVVSVGDTEYLFHTDFDRPTLCDPENEVLPQD
jgi:hypothetical protein